MRQWLVAERVRLSLSPRQQLLRALRIPTLSPGWQASFRALLERFPATVPGAQWKVLTAMVRVLPRPLVRGGAMRALDRFRRAFAPE